MEEYFVLYQFADAGELMRGRGPVGTMAIQHLAEGRGVVAIPPLDYLNGTAINAIDLHVLRLALWAQVKDRRDAVEAGGAVTQIGRVETDDKSLLRIGGAAQMAAIAAAAGQPFAIDWTAEDDSVHALDAAGMIALGVAVGQHINAVHARARQLRDAIEAAATVTDALKIDWTAGWP